MQVAGVGVEHRHLPLPGAHYPGVLVPNMCNVVDRIQVPSAGTVVKVSAVTPDDLQGFFVRNA